MMKLDNIIGLFCFALALVSCAKEEVETPAVVRDAMLFGVEQIAQTRVAYDEQENGGISATFDIGDNVGVYAFYNNFYYYYNEYGVFAESVIFSNQGMWISNDADNTQSLSYSPLRSWTFSTIYGTAPHTLDVMAYYPLVDGYYPEQITMINDDSGAATFEYYYAYQQSTTVDDETTGEKRTTTETIVRSGDDFMTAHTRYDDSGTPEDFRSDMLALESIPLEFTRRLASLNLQVTKPDDYTDGITVTGITVYFDAYTKFTQTVGSTSTIKWDEMTENYSLTAEVNDLNVELAETGWEATPEAGATNEVGNLLDDSNMLFFPPNTNILKIVFSITGGSVGTYTWHPHIATIEANTHYTLSLELDPARAN